jgi:AraC-like DNA-binding protein
MNINAGDGHTTHRVYAPAHFDVIKLTPSWIEDSAKDLEAGRGFSFRSSACENTSVFRTIQRLVRAIAMDEPPFVLESACHEVAHAVVTELAEATPRWPRRSGATRDFRLRRVREYLVEHPGSRPSLDLLERDAGLRKTQLCALFKNEYGVSIGQYWTGCRVAKASAALLQGILAKDVAADLGFSDEAHLSRVFKRHRGLPPRAWASLYRSNTGRHGNGHVSQGLPVAGARRGPRTIW